MVQKFLSGEAKDTRYLENLFVVFLAAAWKKIWVRSRFGRPKLIPSSPVQVDAHEWFKCLIHFWFGYCCGNEMWFRCLRATFQAQSRSSKYSSSRFVKRSCQNWCLRISPCCSLFSPMFSRLSITNRMKWRSWLFFFGIENISWKTALIIVSVRSNFERSTVIVIF